MCVCVIQCSFEFTKAGDETQLLILKNPNVIDMVVTWVKHLIILEHAGKFRHVVNYKS